MSNVISLCSFKSKKFQRYGKVVNSDEQYAYNLSSPENPYWISVLKTQFPKEHIHFQRKLPEEIIPVATYKPKQVYSGYEQIGLQHFPHLHEPSMTVIERECISKYIFFSNVKLNLDNTISARISTILLSPQEIVFNWLSREPVYRILKREILRNSFFDDPNTITTYRGENEISSNLKSRGLDSFFINLGNREQKPFHFLQNST